MVEIFGYSKFLGMSQSYVKADSRGVDFVVVQRGFCCPIPALISTWVPD
jgi:hypothetical protein